MVPKPLKGNEEAERPARRLQLSRLLKRSSVMSFKRHPASNRRVPLLLRVGFPVQRREETKSRLTTTTFLHPRSFRPGFFKHRGHELFPDVYLLCTLYRLSGVEKL